MAAQYIWLLNIYDCSMLIFNLNCGCSWLIVEQGKLSEIAFSVVFENLQKKENKIFDQDDYLQQWLILIGLDESVIDAFVDNVKEVSVRALQDKKLTVLPPR